MVKVRSAVAFALLFVAGGARISQKRSYIAPATKTIAGVPVLSYNLAFEGQPSVQGSTQLEEDWLLVAKKGTIGAQLVNLCEGAKEKACTKVGNPDAGGIAFLEMRGTESDLEELLMLAQGIVEFVEPDVAIEETPEFDELHAADTPLWGLERVGSNSRSGTGRGVHAYILDTGIRYSHGQFGGRAVPAFDTTKWFAKTCKSTDMDCAADARGHGTHCAGTVAGSSFGVAPQAFLHAIKVLKDNGTGKSSMFIEGLEFLSTSAELPAVGSMSLGGGGNLRAYKTAIDAAIEKGVVVVVAAGNQLDDACLYSPAYVPNAITVGATEPGDVRWEKSNFGKCVDIWAPGRFIKSAGVASDTDSALKTGTSMACPHVAGGIALILEEDPARSPEKARQILMTRAEKDAIEGLAFDDTNAMLFVGAQ